MTRYTTTDLDRVCSKLLGADVYKALFEAGTVRPRLLDMAIRIAFLQDVRGPDADALRTVAAFLDEHGRLPLDSDRPVMWDKPLFIESTSKLDPYKEPCVAERIPPSGGMETHYCYEVRSIQGGILGHFDWRGMNERQSRMVTNKE